MPSSKLLDFLRKEAVTLGEALLPGEAEIIPLVGALVGRLARLEKHVLGSIEPPPEVTPAPAPAVANSVQPDAPGSQAVIIQAQAETDAAKAAQAQAEADHQAKEQQLQQAQERVAALEAQLGADNAPGPAVPPPDLTVPNATGQDKVETGQQSGAPAPEGQQP